MKAMPLAAAIVASATFSALGAGALAQTSGASQADFDFCNREAQLMVTASGSASPSTTTPSARPSPGSVGAGSTASGSVGAGAAAGGTTSGGSTLGGSAIGGTTGSGASEEARLQGIAASGAGNPAYQTAYRDCMRRRGF